MKKQLAALGCAALTTLLAACGAAGSLEDGRAAGKDGNVTITVDNLIPTCCYVFDLSIQPAGIVRSFDTPSIALSVPAGEQTFTLSYRESTDKGEPQSQPFASGSATAVIEASRKTSLYIGLVQIEPTDEETALGVVLTSLSASPVDVVKPGEVVSLQATAVSFENLPITYAWEDDCGGVFQSNDGPATSWSLDRLDDGCMISVTAYSGLKSATKSVRIAVVGEGEGSVDVGGEILPSARINYVNIVSAINLNDLICAPTQGTLCERSLSANEFNLMIWLELDDWDIFYSATEFRFRSTVSGPNCGGLDYDSGWKSPAEATFAVPVSKPAASAACAVQITFETHHTMKDNSVVSQSSTFNTGFVYAE